MPGIFPKDDPKQTLILKRIFMAFGSYLVAIAFGAFSLLNGNSVISIPLLALILLGATLSNFAFYMIVRLGINKKYEDPSMTIQQLVVSLTWIAFLMFSEAENRGVFLNVYTMIMMFGLFRLRLEQMLKLAAFALSGYLLVLVGDYFYFPERFEPTREFLRAGVLVSMLIWASLFAGHVSSLRDKLRRRNRDLSVALDEIGKLASHDDLTKAYNRRYIMEALNQEKSRADRSNSTFSVCILDLDHFKMINDRYGHLAGDRVLAAFSERIKGTLRSMDLVDKAENNRFFGRYGGEEFIVVLPDTPLAGAMRCAERIRKVTEEASFDEVFRVTLSAGVGQYVPGETIEDTLGRADAALYQAKHLGRNRVAADNQFQEGSVEDELSESTMTNIVIGPFGAHRN